VDAPTALILAFLCFPAAVAAAAGKQWAFALIAVGLALAMWPA
jgi:hypothetical protein